MNYEINPIQGALENLWDNILIRNYLRVYYSLNQLELFKQKKNKIIKTLTILMSASINIYYSSLLECRNSFYLSSGNVKP